MKSRTEMPRLSAEKMTVFKRYQAKRRQDTDLLAKGARSTYLSFAEITTSMSKLDYEDRVRRNSFKPFENRDEYFKELLSNLGVARFELATMKQRSEKILAWYDSLPNKDKMTDQEIGEKVFKAFDDAVKKNYEDRAAENHKKMLAGDDTYFQNLKLDLFGEQQREQDKQSGPSKQEAPHVQTKEPTKEG